MSHFFNNASRAWEALTFLSRKLGPQQEKYNTYYRKLLAIYKTVKTLPPHVGGSIQIINLSFLPFYRNLSPHQFWGLDFIWKLINNIEHLIGLNNSHWHILHVNTISWGFYFNALSHSQDDDFKLCQQLHSGWRKFLYQMYCDTSYERQCLYITYPFWGQIFKSLHKLSRPKTKVSI